MSWSLYPNSPPLLFVQMPSLLLLVFASTPAEDQKEHDLDWHGCMLHPGSAFLDRKVSYIQLDPESIPDDSVFPDLESHTLKSQVVVLSGNLLGNPRNCLNEMRSFDCNSSWDLRIFRI